MNHDFVTIRIRETGQVTEMMPDVARAMIEGGTAEEVKSSSQPSTPGRQPESMAVAPAAERAIAPQHKIPPTKKKGLLSRLAKSRR